MIDTLDSGGSAGGQAGQDQGGGGTQIRSHHGGCNQLFYPLYNDTGAFLAEMGRHSIQFCYMHKTVRKDFLRDDAVAACQSQKGHKLRLQIRWKAGIGLGGNIGRPPLAVIANGAFIFAFLHHNPNMAEAVGYGQHLMNGTVANPQGAACDSCRRHKGSCFNAVSDDPITDRLEAADAFNYESR